MSKPACAVVFLTPLGHGIEMDGLPKLAYVSAFLSRVCVMMLIDPCMYAIYSYGFISFARAVYVPLMICMWVC